MRQFFVHDPETITARLKSMAVSAAILATAATSFDICLLILAVRVTVTVTVTVAARGAGGTAHDTHCRSDPVPRCHKCDRLGDRGSGAMCYPVAAPPAYRVRWRIRNERTHQ